MTWSEGGWRTSLLAGVWPWNGPRSVWGPTAERDGFFDFLQTHGRKGPAPSVGVVIVRGGQDDAGFSSRAMRGCG